MQKSGGLFQNAYINLFIITIVSFLIYSNTFSVPFVFDDKENIFENPVIRDPGYFTDISRAADDRVPLFSKTRYIGYLSFALNYALHGLDVTGYHIVNLCIHILNALLVYWLVILTFKTPPLNPPLTKGGTGGVTLAKGGTGGVALTKVGTGGVAFSSNGSPMANFIAFFSALLFASHPIQTQAVTYIVQRFTSLATMFYLLSLVMYIKFRHQMTYTKEFINKTPSPSPSPARGEGSNIPPHVEEGIPSLSPPLTPLEIATLTGLTGGDEGEGVVCGSTNDRISNRQPDKTLNLKPKAWYLCSVISAILAMKTKEIAFTLPVVIVLYEFMFFSDNPQSPPRRASEIRNQRLKRFLFLLPFLLTLLIIPVTMINTQLPLDEVIGEIHERSMEDKTISRTDYLFTQFRVIVTYIRLLFLPINQNLDYDYPVYHSFSDPDVFLSFLFSFVIVGIGVYFLYHSKLADLKPATYNLQLMSFGIFWFFITLSVESSVIPIRDVIFEHRLYLPSSGLIAASIAGLDLLTERLFGEKRRNIFIVILISVVLALSTMTAKRNMIWQDEIALWEDTVRKSPLKPRPHSNLANAYQKKGRIDEAEKEYYRSIDLNPKLPGPYNNLGNIYKEQGRYFEARDAYIKVIDIDPKFTEAYYNLGVVLNDMGQKQNALKNLYRALELNPKLAEAHMTIGNIYDEMGRREEALQAYSESLEINPYSYMTYYNRAVLYEGVGDRENAIKDYLRSIELNPQWEASKKRLQALR